MSATAQTRDTSAEWFTPKWYKPKSTPTNTASRSNHPAPETHHGSDSWRLLLKGQRRPAGSVCLEIDNHTDAVGDLYERNTTVHPVLLTVKGHRSHNCA
jgi:hypothetical protein